MTPRLHLGGLAHRIEPRISLDGAALPAATIAVLRRIANQAGPQDGAAVERKLRGGRGIGVLFSGADASAKARAAEALAGHLRLPLYRVDLAAVVSKYLAATENNLRRVFDAAEAAGMLLLFDEADALFGEGTEVKDSHDRYGAAVIAYLFRRMERHRGVTILTVGSGSPLLGAFANRHRFVVCFP